MAYNPANNQGQSTESVDPGALGLPFLQIIQKGSPEFDETHAKHALKRVDGCRPGDVLYVPERRVLPRPILALPVAQTTLYTRWRPRNQGGGFLSNCPLSASTWPGYRRGVPGSPTANKEFVGEDELIYTIYFMLLFKQGEGERAVWKKAVIAFTGGQLKHARNWLKTIAGFSYPDMPDQKAPVFACTFLLNTGPDGNAQGGWMGWMAIHRDRILDFTTDEALLTMAEQASVSAVQDLPKPAQLQ